MGGGALRTHSRVLHVLVDHIVQGLDGGAEALHTAQRQARVRKQTNQARHRVGQRTSGAPAGGAGPPAPELRPCAAVSQSARAGPGVARRALVRADGGGARRRWEALRARNAAGCLETAHSASRSCRTGQDTKETLKGVPR